MATFVLFVSVVVAVVCGMCEETAGLRYDGKDYKQLENAERHPATDFSRHTLVKPKIYHGREKRQIFSSKLETGFHREHLQINLDVDDETMILDLSLNKQLIPKGFFHKKQEKGTYKIHRPTPQEIELCEYNGKVRGRPNSWVAMSTCEGLSGVIFDGKEMHYIEKGSEDDIESKHFLYKQSDLMESNKTCGYEGDATNVTHVHTDNRMLRYKRDVDQPEMVRGPYNANRESKYVELVLVLDNREYKELGESESRVLNHAKKIANHINGLYSPLNIFIALVGVVIWSENDEIQFSPNGDQTLTNFLHYRREKLIQQHPNDNAQLLTKFNFDNGVVGKALKGPICTYEFSGGVNTDHSVVVGLVATTVAHEMGHNFGMEHDTNECKCPEERCIMAPSSSTVAPTHWSSCSLEYLLLAFTHGMDYCLKNKPVALFDSPVCGNGFVEPGEQCDCGLKEHCDNYCCNATSCTLHGNASCATGECCDLTTCLPKTAGTLCRSADYECDLPEYCSGQSEYCPPDIYKLDAESCDNGKAYCYKGFCRTRTDQCKLLWGETGLNSDEQCYKMNTKGTRHGNCGYNKLNQSFFKCDNESVLCGMLHCKHLNERLEFGMESVAILSHTFINKNGSIIPCRTAIVDLGINQVDPGLTPDGALCGDGKMCINQKCMSVSSLRKQGPTCPQDCNGNGWCNNKGHCHCKNGFAPPFCDYPGPGGSLDSGPASDPNARQGVIAALFIIFLGIIPVIAIVAFLSYYARHNLKFVWKHSPTPVSTSKSPNKSDTSKATEANHSLLREDSPPPIGFHNSFFGNFKGFTISPAAKKSEPIRAAPPPPAVAAKKSPNLGIFSKPIQKYNSFRNNVNNGSISTINGGTTAAPALPPPNPGSNARPIISSPVLENSTCTAKELLSPLRNAPKVPVRVAPEAPTNAKPAEEVTKVVQQLEIQQQQQPAPEFKKTTGSSGALNRIASFLRPADKKPSLAQSNSFSVKANKILDKEALRNIEISEPIPQNSQEAIPPTFGDKDPSRTVVMRAQSMRATKESPKPNIQTFGSMRQPRRPLSIPSGARPKSPPPPRPPEKTTKLTMAPTEPDQYDDCLNGARENPRSPSGDNIYAVIEESPLSPAKAAAASNSCSNESFGLLGEIVCEIQNRNFDSIYSTSTLARKKKEAQMAARQQPVDDIYMNTLYPDSEYSNMSGVKSSASTTSSGYILPSAVNIPVTVPLSEEKKSSSVNAPLTTTTITVPSAGAVTVVPPLSEGKKRSVSSFKSEITKPFPRGPVRKVGTVETSPDQIKMKSVDSSPKKNPSPTKAAPGLRTIKLSPTRPKSNRSVTNSPDLVTSCNENVTKAPDVLEIGAKKPAVTSKPTVGTNNNRKTVSFKTDVGAGGRKPVSKASPGVRNAARSNSNVASLQQKFENRNSSGSTPIAKVKT